MSENKAPQGAFRKLIQPIQDAIIAEGYTTPTPIQEQSIPSLLKGCDMIGCAQTGTGKTAAFTLPILQRLHKQNKKTTPGKPRVLILAPTRELAAQIGDSVGKYGANLHQRHAVIFGGVGQGPQVRQIRSGASIVVATPGRLLDLIGQRHLDLSELEVFVLDEADRMLDMGFIHDIRKIIDMLPKTRQTLFFSATMSKEVRALTVGLLKDPERITIAPKEPTVKKIDQQVYYVDRDQKMALLLDLLQKKECRRVILFVRMKHAADRVVKRLAKHEIKAAGIHGDKSQSHRTRSLENFKNGTLQVLVATDIAARGIDVDEVTHVINYDLPNEPETYVHRIGRTARAGQEGIAISLCCAADRDYLRDIESLTRRPLTVVPNHRFHCDVSQHATGTAARPPKRGGGQQRKAKKPPKMIMDIHGNLRPKKPSKFTRRKTEEAGLHPDAKRRKRP